MSKTLQTGQQMRYDAWQDDEDQEVPVPKTQAAFLAKDSFLAVSTSKPNYDPAFA